MKDFMKAVEAYRWKGDVVQTKHSGTDSLSPSSAAERMPHAHHLKDDMGSFTASPSTSSCVVLTYGSKMESQVVRHNMHITGRKSKASNSSASDHRRDVRSTARCAGQKHPVQMKPQDPLPQGSCSKLVFSSRKGVCANLDVERSTNANGHVKDEKKAGKKAQNNSGKRQCPQEGDTNARDLVDFLDDVTFENRHIIEEGFAHVGTEIQQPRCKFAKYSASKKRRETPINNVVSINGKSPFFSRLGILCETSGVNELMPITPTSNTEKGATVIQTYARKRKKKGSVKHSEIKVREFEDGAKRQSASGGPLDQKDVDGQFVRTTDIAMMCLDKNVSSKVSRKAKKSIYFETPARPLGQRDIANTTWVPPVSVHALIQEELYRDPWKLLVACMLLNRTAGTQMRKAIWDLFALCPTPAAAVAMEAEKIQEVIKHLGLQRKRACMIQKFSRDYLGKEWTNVGQLHGIGKYATDAYAIFCEGRWREVKPEDHKLVDYWKYLCETDGVGYAFKDDRIF